MERAIKWNFDISKCWLQIIMLLPYVYIKHKLSTASKYINTELICCLPEPQLISMSQAINIGSYEDSLLEGVSDR